MSEIIEKHVDPNAQLSDMQSFPLRGVIIILIAAVLSFGLFYVLPYEANTNKGLCMLFFIAILWVSEAVHITITALMVPIIAILIGIGSYAKDGSFKALSFKDALAGFSSPTIYLFFGGFALATALHIQKLDKKIAVKIISLAGNNLGIAVISLCVVTALLSMWVSNTGVAAMMLPLALGLLGAVDKEKDRSTFVFVLLGVAYSASIGGLGTMVGSPPNALAGQALNFTFVDWMKIGLPIVIIFMPLMFIILYFVLRPNLNRKIEFEAEYIPWNRARILTTIVFICTALLWLLAKPLSGLVGFKIADGLVALLAAAFIVVLGLATWRDIAENTDWGVLLLFGGGLALSAILEMSGASKVLGETVAGVVAGLPKIIIIFIVAIFVIALTEFTSNTASAALLLPVFASVAAEVGLPKETLTIIIGIGASCAFMMPVATPPNAIVFGTGHIKQIEMIKCGVALCLSCAVILTLVTYLFYA